MKVGVSVWEDRISPVLDGSARVLVVEIEDGKESRRHEVELDEAFLPFKARKIAGLGLDVLICGAVSRPLTAMLTSSGISIVGWATGSVDEVLLAFLNGELETTDFAALPMICGHGRGGRFRGGYCRRFFNKGGNRR
ncbi:MAG: NifB/NifX family molybdenum-iron cluster-binding protein [Candidatus Coatesbacteria bacterium]|nr:NifB/NifX family molybdenum-iron cluster-binding protein [Candidatus Coatesbacteria bacterium]